MQNFAYPVLQRCYLKIGQFFEQKIRRTGASVFAAYQLACRAEHKVSSSRQRSMRQEGGEKRMTIASGSFAIRQLVLQVDIVASNKPV